MIETIAKDFPLCCPELSQRLSSFLMLKLSGRFSFLTNLPKHATYYIQLNLLTFTNSFPVIGPSGLYWPCFSHSSRLGTQRSVSQVDATLARRAFHPVPFMAQPRDFTRK